MSKVLAEWHPVTHDFGLIQAPVENVLSAFRNWHASIGIEYERTEFGSSLSDAFAAILPLANSKMRRLFIQTRSDWVACFQNGIQGSDPFPAMSHLAQDLGVLSMRVCSTPENSQFPATIWEVYAPHSLGGVPPLGYRRSLAAAKDGGKWVFEEAGERFPFELSDRYQAPLKRDRFTSEMLRDYLKEFGVRLFADDFMLVDQMTPAVRLQQITNVWHSPEFTLKEVVAGKPWHRKPRSGDVV